jgi:hypothetical protein
MHLETGDKTVIKGFYNPEEGVYSGLFYKVWQRCGIREA